MRCHLLLVVLALTPPLYDEDMGRDSEVFIGVSIGVAGVQIGTPLPPRSWSGGWPSS
ncbi:MAG: hypothetical protein AB8I08_29990 [Sandaracinaceae bacterium]